MLQCVAVYSRVGAHVNLAALSPAHCVAVCCSVLQCVAVCYRVGAHENLAAHPSVHLQGGARGVAENKPHHRRD